MKNEFYKLNIAFLNGTKYSSPKVKIFINVNEEDEFIELENNSICSFDHVLLKIKDIENNKDLFLFLKDVNILIENQQINISSCSTKQFYISLLKKIDFKKELSIIKKQINILELKKNFGLSIDEYIKLENLKEKHYILNLREILNLTEEN